MAGPRSCPARAAPGPRTRPHPAPVLPAPRPATFLWGRDTSRSPYWLRTELLPGFCFLNHVLNPEGGVRSTFTNSTAVCCPGTCSILRLALSTRDGASSVPACSEEGYCYAHFRVKSWSSGGPTPQGERSRTVQLNQARRPQAQLLSDCVGPAPVPETRKAAGRAQKPIRPSGGTASAALSGACELGRGFRR